MKLFRLVFLAICIVLFVSGCDREKFGSQIANTRDIEDVFDQKETSFVIITNETEASFLQETEKALLEKKEVALQFNVFRNDGENENKDGLSKNPFRFDMPHVNAIYYIQNGQVVGEYDLENINEKELKRFLIQRNEVQ